MLDEQSLGLSQDSVVGKVVGRPILFFCKVDDTMKVIAGDILSITSGVICHQVNCRGAFGAGVSGVLGRRYPAVETAYRAVVPSPALLGTYQFVPVTETLGVYNIFGQVDYGNARKTGHVYTDMRALTTALRTICDAHDTIYVPYGIGCGLAGGSWDEFTAIMADVDNLVVMRKDGA